jgi:hypothetical protein
MAYIIFGLFFITPDDVDNAYLEPMMSVCPNIADG